MKQLKCEMCGGADLIKTEGVYVCQSCGAKYSVEEAKKLFVEGKVDVSGSSVSIDETGKIDNWKDLMVESLVFGDNDNTLKYANMILEVFSDDAFVSEIACLVRQYNDVNKKNKNKNISEQKFSLETFVLMLMGPFNDDLIDKNKIYIYKMIKQMQLNIGQEVGISMLIMNFDDLKHYDNGDIILAFYNKLLKFTNSLVTNPNRSALYKLWMQEFLNFEKCFNDAGVEHDKEGLKDISSYITKIDEYEDHLRKPVFAKWRNKTLDEFF